MARIEARFSHERNKEIILASAFSHRGMYKTYVKKDVLGYSNWDYYMNNIFEQLFTVLVHEEKIKYIPHCPLQKGAFYMKLKIKTKQCGNCDSNMYDKTKGLSTTPLFECEDCKEVFWKDMWWNRLVWAKHVELELSV